MNDWDRWYSKNKDRKNEYTRKYYQENKHDRDGVPGLLSKKKMKLANETPEQRQERLTKMREYAKARKEKLNEQQS